MRATRCSVFKDDVNIMYRSRLVAEEFGRHGDPGLVEHHGERRCTSILQIRPARRRCSWSFAKKAGDPRMNGCVENFQCRCTARGLQQKKDRNVTPTCFATAGWECLVGTHAFLDIRNATFSRLCTGMNDFVSTAQGEVRHHNRHHRTRWRKQDSSPDVEQVLLRQGQWVHRRTRRQAVRDDRQGARVGETLSTPESDMHHEGDELLNHSKVQEVRVFVRSSELLGHRQNCLAIRSQGLLQIDVETDSVQHPGRARPTLMQTGQATRRTDGAPMAAFSCTGRTKSWSKTQSLTAPESELHALVKASPDAICNIGCPQRQGVGRLRHMDCSFLFVQSLNAQKVVQNAKVPRSIQQMSAPRDSTSNS